MGVGVGVGVAVTVGVGTTVAVGVARKGTVTGRPQLVRSTARIRSKEPDLDFTMDLYRRLGNVSML